MRRKKRPRKPAIEEDTSNLPCEVIYIILTKLPVNSLMRFRCVCKPWCALISEPQFIKTHLSEAIKSDRRRLLGSLCDSECFLSLDYGVSGKSEEELYFPIKKYRTASVLCSCNGLVLLGIDYDKMKVLWNPSTRAYKNFSCPYTGYHYKARIGLCFDSCIGDYKVVFIYWDHNDRNQKFIVYTCKTKSWTVASDFPYLMCYGITGVSVSVHGAPHWVVSLKQRPNGYAMPIYKCDFSIPTRIICFDPVEEKFKELLKPKHIHKGDNYVLTDIRGCLGIYVNSSYKQRIDIWVMKEYGKWNSWTKLITFKDFVGTSLPYPMPWCFTKKGEVFLSNNRTELFLYNPKEKKLSRTTPSTSYKFSSTAVSCVDSLVLPTFGKLTKRQQHIQKEKVC